MFPIKRRQTASQVRNYCWLFFRSDFEVFRLQSCDLVLPILHFQCCPRLVWGFFWKRFVLLEFIFVFSV